MHHYFNINIDDQKYFPTSFCNDLIIVIRNPLDRMESATKGIPQLGKTLLGMSKAVNAATGKEHSKEFIKDWMVFYIHCKPYFHRVSEKPFRIIDFNKLSDYIPRNITLHQSPTTYSSGNTDPKSVYVENRYFTLDDLEKEYDVYLSLLKEREQISVAEWKEKTS
jgi:hypothetical protein